jgi:hypothetical protein
MVFPKVLSKHGAGVWCFFVRWQVYHYCFIILSSRATEGGVYTRIPEPIQPLLSLIILSDQSPRFRGPSDCTGS